MSKYLAVWCEYLPDAGEATVDHYEAFDTPQEAFDKYLWAAALPTIHSASMAQVMESTDYS